MENHRDESTRLCNRNAMMDGSVTPCGIVVLLVAVTNQVVTFIQKCLYFPTPGEGCVEEWLPLT